MTGAAREIAEQWWPPARRRREEVVRRATVILMEAAFGPRVDPSDNHEQHHIARLAFHGLYQELIARHFQSPQGARFTPACDVTDVSQWWQLHETSLLSGIASDDAMEASRLGRAVGRKVSRATGLRALQFGRLVLPVASATGWACRIHRDGLVMTLSATTTQWQVGQMTCTVAVRCT